MNGISCSSPTPRSATRTTRRILGTISALALLATSTAGAQDRTWGLGLGIANTNILGADSFLIPTIYVPIMLGGSLMIEPGIGYIRTNETTATTEETNSLLSVGAGLLFLAGANSDGHMYFGPRIGILATSETFTGTPDESATHIRISGVAGGEYFLKPNFSLGGEVGLSWLKIDEEDPADESSLLGTIAEFRIRWYFR